MRKPKRITIKMVAREAEVSTQTVSRVLNERPDVSPETRQRVQEIIERLGYHPSALARSLIQQRSRTIGIITAGLNYVGPSRALNGITQRAERLGYVLLLKESASFQPADIQSLIRPLLARQVDGIIWAIPDIGSNHDWIREHAVELPVPVVFLTIEPDGGTPSVSVDNYKGGCLAVDHLLQQGCREIGHLSGPLDWWEARARKAGWRDTLANAALPATDECSVEGNWSPASGERAMRQLLEQYPDMDGLFVANDQMALGALNVAIEQGVYIPERLAVVGFDNLPESAHFHPPLTTVEQDLHQLGCSAIEKLVHIIEAEQIGDEVSGENVTILEPALIVRESSSWGRVPGSEKSRSAGS